jgi:hypothetical protein
VFEAHELAPGETVAKEIVERIDDLFGIDRVARENGYDFAASGDTQNRPMRGG